MAISPQNNEKTVFYTGKLCGLTGMCKGQAVPLKKAPQSSVYSQVEGHKGSTELSILTSRRAQRLHRAQYTHK